MQKQEIYSHSTYLDSIFVSLNGAKIAFIAGNIENNNLVSIYTINPDGTGLIEAATHNGSLEELSWSADGSAILYRLSNNDTRLYELRTVNINGSNNQKLDVTFKSPEYKFIKWSTKSLKDKNIRNKDTKIPRISW